MNKAIDIVQEMSADTAGKISIGIGGGGGDGTAHH